MSKPRPLRPKCAALAALAAVTLLLSNASDAGIFSDSLSSQDAATIHKIAVLSALGDTLRLDTTGLTAFQQRSTNVAVPQWHMDATVTEHALELLGHDQRFAYEPLHLSPDVVVTKESLGYEELTSGGRRMIMDQAQAQGADAVLVICRATNEQDRMRSSGYGLRHGHLFGKDYVGILEGIGFILLRVPVNSVLAQQRPGAIIQSKMAWPIKTSWEDLPPDDRMRVEDAIKDAIYRVIDWIHSGGTPRSSASSKLNMIFLKPKTVPSTPFSRFIRDASASEKKKVYVTALKRASDAQNSVIQRVLPSRRLRSTR